MNYRRPMMKYRCMAPFDQQEMCDHYQGRQGKGIQGQHSGCRYFSIFSGCMKSDDSRN